MGSSTSKAATTTSRPGSDAITHEQAPQEDKLQNGPCADVYELLQTCQAEKRIKRNDRALAICVSETDLLIKCIHRHPAYFQQIQNYPRL